MKVQKEGEKVLQKNLKDTINIIKNEIKQAQVKTIMNANKNLITLYYNVGKLINENSKYGNNFIEQIEKDLRMDMPKLEGFSLRNLKYMKKFYKEYNDNEKVQQLVAQIPWGHNIVLMNKFKDIEIRKIYAENIIKNGWSRSVLEFQIDTEFHLRIGNSENNFKNVLPEIESDLVKNTLKDPYIFDFICLKEKYKEKELEDNMITRIRDVLLELGNGFSFVGSQYKIMVGEDEYFIDLLFYHLKLRCYIVVDLKVTEFKPEYAGKMNFYLNVVNDVLNTECDNRAIGLILCKEKNKLKTQYSLQGYNQPMGVSSYEISKYIPEDILESLPTEEDINLHIDIEESEEGGK